MENFRPVKSPELVDGDTIKRVLFFEELSQWDLARLFGVTQGQVSRWKRGETPVPPMIRHVLSCETCYDHFIRQGAARAQSNGRRK